MKLHFLSAHAKIGPMRKSLGLADGSTRSYPLAGKVTSHEEELDVVNDGVVGYRNLLAQHARYGHALYKGLFTRSLVNESRRGNTDKTAKTEFLVLDIDGLKIDSFKAKSTCRPEDVQEVAEHVLSMLPAALHNVSYVAVASSSFGLKDKQVSIHIHFLLEKPVSHRALKDWLKSLNFTQQAIFEKLELTSSKMQLKSVVDPCLAEPARIVYIAPPLFGPRIQNPFIDDSDRIIAVEKELPLLDLDDELSMLAQKQGVVDQRRDAELKRLQKDAGVSSKKLDFVQLRLNGGTMSVVNNPPEINLEFAYEDHEFVRYNVRGKSNNAFWVSKNNPEVVHCFIPDEPAFLFRKADPQTYAEHIEKYGEVFEEVKDEETGVVRKVVRTMLICRESDNYLSVEYDKENDSILELQSHTNPAAAANWLKFYGVPVPDPVQPVYQVMNPNMEAAIYDEGDKKYLNRFVPSPYMRSSIEVTAETLRYGQAWQVHQECPAICEVILNMLGDDMDCFEHFFNWLAYIMQTRDKTETAWLVHGTEGTGKGLFFKRIAKPLIGERYSMQNTLQGIADDQFNGWMEDLMFLMVDEFNMKGASNLTKTVSMLKNLITEPTISLRKMQQQQRDARQRLNFLFATNDLDAMPAADKRRYNIAPRQQRMLRARIPCSDQWRDQFDEVIESELPKFAEYLTSFKVNRNQVSRILENQAKVDLHEASMTMVDRFFESVRTGAFEYFVNIFDRPMEGLEAKELTQLTRAKTFLTACLEHVNTGNPCYIHIEDLRHLYSFMSGKDVSVNAINKMRSRYELPQRRVTKPVGARKSMTTRPRCIEVSWSYKDEAILEQLKASFTAMPGTNTVPYQQPEQGAQPNEPETAEQIQQRMQAAAQQKQIEEAQALLAETNANPMNGWD